MRQHCVQHSGHGTAVKEEERRHPGRVLLSRIVSECHIWQYGVPGLVLGVGVHTQHIRYCFVEPLSQPVCLRVVRC